MSEALRLTKTVVYLNLTDAFNSVNHSAILTTTEQCLYPQWIIQITQSVYDMMAAKLLLLTSVVRSCRNQLQYIKA